MKSKSRPVASGIAGAQSIRRTIAILRILARESKQGAPLIEVTTSSQLSRPTAHRMLKCLIEEGMVVQDEETRNYLLGPLVYELGLAAVYRPKDLETYREAIRRIAHKTQDTVYLTMRSGGDSCNVDRIEATYPIRTVTTDVGERRPLGTGGSGLALLATLDDDEVENIVEQNKRIYPKHGTSAKKVLDGVAAAREAGYALRLDNPPGAAAIGVAIRANGDPATFALSITSTRERIMERLPELYQILHKEATLLLRSTQDNNRARSPR